MLDVMTYAAAKKYTQDSLAGAGALKGEPGVYVGSGERPPDTYVQVDPTGGRITIPEINDTIPSKEDVYSSSKVEALIQELRQEIEALKK